METEYLLLESVATWVCPKTFLTVGAMTVNPKDTPPKHIEFLTDGISLIDDEISEEWVKSLSNEDHTKVATLFFVNHMTGREFENNLEIKNSRLIYN